MRFWVTYFSPFFYCVEKIIAINLLKPALLLCFQRVNKRGQKESGRFVCVDLVVNSGSDNEVVFLFLTENWY